MPKATHFTRYVAIQDKLIKQYFVITIYRSQHARIKVKEIKPQVHQSCQLLRGAELTGAVFME